MAYAQRPVAPLRKLIAAVLGTVATFVTLFGLGMTSWAIVALGVALLVLAIALATVRGGGRAWVIGVGYVHTVSDPPTAYAFGRCELQLVLDAPGLPARSKKVIEPRVPVAKWPARGQALPIKVALDDQRHVRVLWDEVPTHAEAAAAVADLPPDVEATDPIDEVLIAEDAPPWAQRDPDDDFPEPPGTDPLPEDLTTQYDDRERVVVHQRPGEPVVLEGTLVGPPTTTPPLPHRATTTPTQRPPVDEYDAPIAPDPADVPLDEPAAEGPAPFDGLDDPVFPFEAPEAAGAGAPISGVGITLLVTDLARSVAFYRDVLGFAEVDGGESGAVLASGSTRIVLRRISEAEPVNRRMVHLNLEVDDIRAAYRRLRDEGVDFVYEPRVVNRGAKLEVWAAAFRDPDGHGIALTQWRERAAG